MTRSDRDHHFPDVNDFSIAELNAAYDFYEKRARQGDPPTMSSHFCRRFNCSRKHGKILLAASKFKYEMIMRGIA